MSFILSAMTARTNLSNHSHVNKHHFSNLMSEQTVYSNIHSCVSLLSTDTRPFERKHHLGSLRWSNSTMTHVSKVCAPASLQLLFSLRSLSFPLISLLLITRLEGLCRSVTSLIVFASFTVISTDLAPTDHSSRRSVPRGHFLFTYGFSSLVSHVY